MLARHEQALQLCVLDHLREIDARRLYLRRGLSSLFDYTVRELHYTEAAAWRRIKAMRLCRDTRGVREWLQDGSLNLSNAALLQNSFERWERSGASPVAAGSAGGGRAGTGAAPRAGSAPATAPGAVAGARLPVLGRQFEFGSELRRSGIGGADFGGAASRGNRRRAIDGATSATKSGKPSGRSIPIAVRREVWRRDHGCCSYVDRHTGRRCGSRFFPELDHIVPVAPSCGNAPPPSWRRRASG